MSEQPEPRRERLELAGTSALERRLLVGDAAPRHPRSKPTIKPVAPSGLLGRLQAFLPALEAANADLQQQLEQHPASEVAMERGSDDEREGPVVELDLACGLFDLKDEAAVAAAERAMLAQGVAVDRFEGASTDDSSEEDSSSGSEDEGEQADGVRRQQQGLAAAAGAAADGIDAMQEDEPEGSEGTAAAAAATAAAGEQPLLGAAPGRRRKGKQRSKRHAGIQELS
ncbi:hypothetical protein C2E21_7933 [Chlorella sorokiniana]|uniref:Uncharacterized protein n=1 Tax=Chlorella sorokiniana TaxID=3076 RepID=A0A2P6TGQ1_CHLSO|nr:hypothetical protein C2E21_7933 [Chlorella sorokiniana]|eukprot:PRW33293.1 hypothetical protein C2E21_7933 [Chlorella sorokiniana]